MPGIARHPVAIFSAVGFLGISTLFLASRPFATALAAPHSTAVATSDLQVVLIRAGLDAEALASVGASTSHLSTVAGLAADSIASAPLAPLDAAVSSAQTARDAMQRKIQAGTATTEEVASMPGLESTLASALAARTAAIDALFTASTAQLSSAQRATLATIRANRSWKLPIEFLTVNREEADWVKLRQALANERITAKQGVAPNATCQALLATERAKSEVAAAKTAYDANITALKAAFDAIGD